MSVFSGTCLQNFSCVGQQEVRQGVGGLLVGWVSDCFFFFGFVLFLLIMLLFCYFCRYFLGGG